MKAIYQGRRCLIIPVSPFDTENQFIMTGADNMWMRRFDYDPNHKFVEPAKGELVYGGPAGMEKDPVLYAINMSRVQFDMVNIPTHNDTGYYHVFVSTEVPLDAFERSEDFKRVEIVVQNPSFNLVPTRR